MDLRGLFPDDLLKIGERTAVSSHLETRASREYVVAREGEGIVGVCYIDKSYLRQGTIRLGNLIVDRDHRHMGIGRSLVERVIDFGKEHDCNKIWLWGWRELPDATKLYESLGFAEEGVQRAQFCGRDAILYGLVLK
jgi:GNAT superfamily N-acetyltransferase